MSSQVLARKYRPQTFEEMIGQKAVVQTLQNAIRTNRIAQAYLFSGTRGVGKTTAARILAKALNCEKGPTPTPCGVCEFCTAIKDDRLVDVLEIDGASNTGVDNIRNLRDLVQYKAMHKDKYKIVIIDEVHQISKPAFNALLKTLEEPPEKTIFIFATTELQKVPATIVSRCQYFEFKKVSQKDLMTHLANIARKENLTLTENGFGILARAADGSIRDGLTLLDQAVAFCGNTIADADLNLILGTINSDLLFEFSSAVSAGDPGRIFPLVEKVIESGYDLRSFAKKLIEHFRDLLIVRTMDKPQEILHLTEGDLAPLRNEAAKSGQEDLLRYLQALQAGEPSLKHSSNPQIAFETLLVKLCHFKKLVDLKDILAGIDGSIAADGPAVPPAGSGGNPVVRPSVSRATSANSYGSPSRAYSRPEETKPTDRSNGAPPARQTAPNTSTPGPTAAVAARGGRSGVGIAPKTSGPDRSPEVSSRVSERETALRDPRVMKFQDKLKGRVISVGDPKPPQSTDEE